MLWLSPRTLSSIVYVMASSNFEWIFDIPIFAIYRQVHSYTYILKNILFFACARVEKIVYMRVYIACYSCRHLLTRTCGFSEQNITWDNSCICAGIYISSPHIT